MCVCVCVCAISKESKTKSYREINESLHLPFSLVTKDSWRTNEA